MKNMTDNKTDICVIGGGAAGLTAAICAKREDPSLSVTILEKNERAGKKLSATGNGRCNITNMNAEGVRTILSFMTSVGIAVTEEDEGRIYPASFRAEDVTAALIDAASKEYAFERGGKIKSFAGASILTGAAVTDVNKIDDGFAVTYEKKAGEETVQGQITARALLISAGGKAAPSFGSSGDSYTFARKLGLPCGRIYPVLTPAEGYVEGLTAKEFAELKGVRARAEVHLKKQGREILIEKGEAQFTSYGISGIAVFNASLEMKIDDPRGEDPFGDYSLELDLLPGTDEAMLAQLIGERLSAGLDPLRSFTPAPLCKAVKLIAARRDDDKYAELLAGIMKRFPFKITGVRGWKDAQCTAGGVLAEALNSETMEALRVPGLYVAGEAMEYAGPCGGYNLSNAWVSGMKAGKAMAASIGRRG